MKWQTYFYLYFVLSEPIAILLRRLVIGQNTKPWQGGNGCNFVKLFGMKSPCCKEHDRAYKQGGWFFARIDADWKLFKCVARGGIFAKIFSPLVFVGARLGGMWSFQYGPKQNVPEQ